MIFCSNYIVYRCDRKLSQNSKKSGGGCLIAILSKLNSEEINYDDKSIEFVCAKVKFPNLSLFVCCAYIAPGLSVEIYLKYIEALSLWD